MPHPDRRPLMIAGRTVAVASAFVLLTVYSLLLRHRPESVLRRARRAAQCRPVGQAFPDIARFRWVLSAVDRAAELHPWRPRCLERAFVSWCLLRCLGEPAIVVVGVSRTGVTLDAHAWVEVDGVTLDGAHRAFSKLLRLP